MNVAELQYKPEFNYRALRVTATRVASTEDWELKVVKEGLLVGLYTYQLSNSTYVSLTSYHLRRDVKHILPAHTSGGNLFSPHVDYSDFYMTPGTYIFTTPVGLVAAPIKTVECYFFIPIK